MQVEYNFKKDDELYLALTDAKRKFDMEVDNIPAKGDIKVLVQLYYDSDEIKDYFKELYGQNPNGWADLKISCDDLKNFIQKDYIEPSGKILLKKLNFWLI